MNYELKVMISFCEMKLIKQKEPENLRTTTTQIGVQPTTWNFEL